eukprot:jgi/Mesvir1/29636/Mv21486-RA.1
MSSSALLCGFAAPLATDISMDHLDPSVSEFKALLGLLTQQADMAQKATQPAGTVGASSSEYDDLVGLLIEGADRESAPSPSVIAQRDSDIKETGKSVADAATCDDELPARRTVHPADLGLADGENHAPEHLENFVLSPSEDERALLFSRLADIFPSARMESVSKALEFGGDDFATAVEVLLAEEEELEEATTVKEPTHRRRRSQWVKAPSLLGANGAPSRPRSAAPYTLPSGCLPLVWSKHVKGCTSLSNVNPPPSSIASGTLPAHSRVWNGRHPALHWYVDGDAADRAGRVAVEGMSGTHRAREKRDQAEGGVGTLDAFPPLDASSQGGAGMVGAGAMTIKDATTIGDKVCHLQAAFPSLCADVIEDVLLANRGDADMTAALLVDLTDDDGTGRKDGPRDFAHGTGMGDGSLDAYSTGHGYGAGNNFCAGSWYGAGNGYDSRWDDDRGDDLGMDDMGMWMADGASLMSCGASDVSGDNGSDGSTSTGGDAAPGDDGDAWAELDAAIAASLQDAEHAALQGGPEGEGWSSARRAHGGGSPPHAWHTVAPKKAVGGKARGGSNSSTKTGAYAGAARACAGVAVSARAANEQRHYSDMHARARNTYLRLAQMAYAAGDGASAKELSRQGHHHDRMMRASDNIARDLAFQHHNAGLDPRLSVDLHGLYVSEALETLDNHLRDLCTLGRFYQVPVHAG